MSRKGHSVKRTGIVERVESKSFLDDRKGLMVAPSLISQYFRSGL